MYVCVHGCGETSVAIPVENNGGEQIGNKDERGNTESDTKKCMIKL